MTREEAIMVLEMVDAYGLADEAKKMAITALQAEPKVVGDIVSRGDTRRVVTVTEPSDLISREEVKRVLRDVWVHDAKMPIGADPFLALAMQDIEDIPSVSADRPSGEWEYDFDKDDHYCTRCHKYAGDWEMKLLSDYCPSCGARMEGGGE